MKFKTILNAAILIGLSSQAALADVHTGDDFNISVDVVSSCSITVNDPVSTSHTTASIAAGAGIVSTGSIVVNCDVGAWALCLGAGNNGTSTTRSLAFGADKIDYNLLNNGSGLSLGDNGCDTMDASYTSTFNGPNLSVIHPAGTDFQINLAVELLPTGSNVARGTYTDAVGVTIIL